MKQVLFYSLLLGLLMACENRAGYTFSFQEMTTPTTASIRGLSVIDENTLWLSGSEGTVLRTTDGGKSWIDCSIAFEAENDFRSLHAFDSLSAFVIGIDNPALIYHTVDGGLSWQTKDSIHHDGVFFNSLLFASDNNALAISDQVDGQFLLIQTKDGGNSWNRVNALPQSLSGEGNFAASNTCIEYFPSGEAWFATGVSESRVFMTKDNAYSWEVASTPVLCNESADGIYSIDFRNPNHGIVVGGNYQYPERNDSIAAYTIDGGYTWNLAETMPNGFHSCVQYFDDAQSTIAVAIGRVGFDYTLDDGKNWIKGGKEKYYTMRPIPGQLCAFVAGSDGRFAKLSISK